MLILLPIAVTNIFWFAPPLIIAISFVYAASRHEPWPAIIRHAIRWIVMMTLLLILSTAVLLLVNALV